MQAGISKVHAIIIGVLLVPILAFAATRTVYLDGFATATSTNGFTAAATARCIILLNNPSSVQQTVEMSIYAYSTGAGALAGNATPPTGYGWVAAGGAAGSSASTLTATLNATGSSGSSARYEFTYPTYPASTTTPQVLICRGTFKANDVSQPGYVLATANLITFSEASAMQTMGVTGASTSFKGNAVYSQIPISVNRGKPF